MAQGAVGVMWGERQELLGGDSDKWECSAPAPDLLQTVRWF